MNSPFPTEDDHGMSPSTFLNELKTIGEIRRWIADMAGDQPCTGYIELYPYPENKTASEKDIWERAVSSTLHVYADEANAPVKEIIDYLLAGVHATRTDPHPQHCDLR